MRNKTNPRLINWTISVGSIIALVLILNSDLFIHKKSEVVEGQIKEISIGGVDDIVILLENNPKRYNINRGSEIGLSLDTLRKDWANKTIKIKTEREGLNLFDINDNLKEVNTISIDDSVYYRNSTITEWRLGFIHFSTEKSEI
jgi:hypothetical protein